MDVPFRFEDEIQAEERRARYLERFDAAQKVARSRDLLHTPKPMRKSRSYSGMIIHFHDRDARTMRKLMDKMDRKGFRYIHERQNRTNILEIDPVDFDRLLDYPDTNEHPFSANR